MSIVDNVRVDVNDFLDEHVDFIQEQIEFHKDNAARFAGDSNPYRSAKHKETAANFRAIRDFMMRQEDRLSKTENVAKRPFLALSPEDIDGLPKEQLEELSITSSDKAEFSIMAMLEANNGIMSLDQIIVGLYRETSEIQMRPKITARLHRMGNKGLIYKVPTKKGVYSLEKISQTEAEAMFKGVLVPHNQTEQ